MIQLDGAIIAVLAAILSVLVSGWVAVRAGSWRNSDEARQIDKRLGGLEARVSVIENKLASEVERLDGLVERLEAAVRRAEDIILRGG